MVGGTPYLERIHWTSSNVILIFNGLNGLNIKPSSVLIMSSSCAIFASVMVVYIFVMIALSWFGYCIIFQRYYVFTLGIFKIVKVKLSLEK
jgi:hypothetical protein